MRGSLAQRLERFEVAPATADEGDLGFGGSSKETPGQVFSPTGRSAVAFPQFAKY
jgi:hypothetical protein